MQATPDRSYKYPVLGTLWAFVGVRAYSFGYPRSWEISAFKSLLKEATLLPARGALAPEGFRPWLDANLVIHWAGCPLTHCLLT